jgi:hypothetical protein
MKLEEFISLVSQLNSQPFRDPNNMLNELLSRVEKYSVSPDGYKIPLMVRYKNRVRRFYVVVSIDKEKKLLLVDWRYMSPQDHELIKQKHRDQEWKMLKRMEKKYIRMYFKFRRWYH